MRTRSPIGDEPVTFGRRRRWLVGLEPVFEGGWFHRGKRAHAWDVEEKLVAVALFGDVTVDLLENRSAPAEMSISAYALLRDVDVLVAADAQVELTGRANNNHLRNNVPAVSGKRVRVIRIHGHTLLGDVTVRRDQAHE